MQLRQHARALAAVVDAVGHAKAEVDHAHFEHVARRCALDVNRPGEHVHAGAFLAARIDIARIGEHLLRRDAAGGEKLHRVHVVDDSLMRDGIDAQRLAGPHARDRRAAIRYLAPGHGFRRRAHVRFGGLPHRRATDGAGEENEQSERGVHLVTASHIFPGVVSHTFLAFATC